MRQLIAIGLALAMIVAATDTMAQTRRSLFLPEGCSPTSRISPCPTRTLPVPVGDPTDGPLTDAIRSGPLDPPKDPLGFDAPLPAPRGPLAPPVSDRLGRAGKG